ncbi:MAG: sporulation protein YunB [Acutalibacteraceae bacterium]|nr:sporulation protein YunB [Acutalibacteraceae bacterium]
MKHRGRYRRIPIIKIIFTFTLLFITASYIIFESQIESSMLDITRLKAEELCTNAINTAVLSVLEKNEYTYDNFAKVSQSGNSVTSISTDSVNTNKFKSMVTLKSQDEIGNMSGMEINYKLGDFCGSELLTGRGPDIIIKLFFSASVTADMESKFESCGLNQTRHILNIIITSKVYITSDKNLETYTTVITTVPVAESIIVGSVPSLYLQKQ